MTQENLALRNCFFGNKSFSVKSNCFLQNFKIIIRKSFKKIRISNNSKKKLYGDKAMDDLNKLQINIIKIASNCLQIIESDIST